MEEQPLPDLLPRPDLGRSRNDQDHLEDQNFEGPYTLNELWDNSIGGFYSMPPGVWGLRRFIPLGFRVWALGPRA